MKPSRLLLTLAFPCLLVAQASLGQSDYIAFGDSITEGTGDVGDVGGYPIRLEGMIEGATVRNHGYAGEKTPEGITRIDGVLDEGGDVLLLMEGSNDLSRSDISNETTLFNLAEMARKAENRGIEAVHATLIPRLPTAKRDRDNFSNQEVNQSIRDLAGRRGRRLVDNFEVFSVQQDLFSRLYADFPTDPVGHPNPEGYDLMAATFRDLLAGVDRVPPVPGIIDPNHGEAGVPIGKEIAVDVWDFGDGLDTLSVDLTVNGAVVDSLVVSEGANATATFDLPASVSGLVRVGLRATDRAAPANSFNRELARFLVGTETSIEGDIDFDGRVDGFDLIRIAITFGLGRSARAFDPRADLNSDGVIDGFDLAILAANFGRSL